MPSTGFVSRKYRYARDCADIATAFYYVFKFVLILWMALPMTNGAQIVFRSLIQPVFSRFFSQSGSTAADLRGKADAAMKSQ
jgi:receptor expression-enhancing protein 5/6